MYKFNQHMSSYEVPLKQDLPCLKYDVSCYCELLLSVLPCSLPDYLSTFEKCLRRLARQKKSLKPTSFPTEYRVYIIDYRLNILFASLDPDGRIATSFSKYPCNSKTMEDYYYGDGEFIGGSMLPGDPYDNTSMINFSSKYGFLPVEELSMASALVFVGDHIDERRCLSQFQTQVLMQRYRSKNFVDWKEIVKQISNDFRWLK